MNDSYADDSVRDAVSLEKSFFSLEPSTINRAQFRLLIDIAQNLRRLTAPTPTVLNPSAPPMSVADLFNDPKLVMGATRTSPPEPDAFDECQCGHAYGRHKRGVCYADDIQHGKIFLCDCDSYAHVASEDMCTCGHGRVWHSYRNRDNPDRCNVKHCGCYHFGSEEER